MTPTRVLIFCVLLTFALEGCDKRPETVTASGPPSSSPARAGISSSADVVKVTVPPVSITANGSADAVVNLSISPGFHINANPATFSYLIATELKPEKRNGFTAGSPIYPGAVKKKFEFAPEPLAVYEGTIQIKLPLRASADATKGISQLPMDLVVQACDHEKCYPPVAMDATVAIEVR